MILVDTSVWVDHLRAGEQGLEELLQHGRVLMHPFVIGELACGNLQNREMVLMLLHELPRAPVATDEEALLFIDRHRLYGLGIGYIDAHLLASFSCTRWRNSGPATSASTLRLRPSGWYPEMA